MAGRADSRSRPSGFRAARRARGGHEANACDGRATAPGHRAEGPRLESHRSGSALHQQTSGLIDESRRLRRIPSIPVGIPMSAPHSSRRPNAGTLRCHLAWHLVAMLIVLTGQLAPKRPRPLCRRRLHGNGTDQARVEQTVHRMMASARRAPGSRRTPGPLQGLRCSLVPVCRSTPPTQIPTARQTDAIQRAGVASLSSGSFRAPGQMSASVLRAGVVRSAP